MNRRWLLSVRRDDTARLELIEVVAPDSFSAIRDLPDDVGFVDFEQFSCGQYSLPVEDERAETQRDLEQTRAEHARLTGRVAALTAAGEPADSSYLRKLGWQLAACARWITRYEKELAT